MPVCAIARLRYAFGALLRAWDRGVIPLVRRSERHFSPPFGQSVLAIGHTPGIEQA